MHDAGSLSGAATTNLPVALTSFVGREWELAEARRLLGATRLLTLTGAGGIGKTRLALKVAARLLPDFPDGVWLVEMAHLTEPGHAPRAVAAVLGIREQPDQPLLTTLVTTLGSRRLLLVLDNCEHLIDTCACLADELLAACPHLSILATSREALAITGEVIWRVASLAVPPPDQPASVERLLEYPALQLFLERVMAVRPDFVLSERNVAAMVEICWRLDGIPLALELAAARARVLAVEQIAERLQDRFTLLTGGRRTAAPRQQTLRAALDWSYDLLRPPEQRLLRRLAVFVGGWTLAAAENVCAGEGIAAGEILDLLTGLVDKSLVMAEPHGAEQRYRLLETVRAYAEAKLSRAEAATARDRHCDWCLAMAENAARWHGGDEQSPWLDRLEVEHDNLRAALGWRRDAPERAEAGLALAAALKSFWLIRNHFVEGTEWLDAFVMAAPDRNATRATALVGLAQLHQFQGRRDRALTITEEALAAFRELGDAAGLANALAGRGLAMATAGELGLARVDLEESVAIARSLDDRREMATRLRDLGLFHVLTGDYCRARLCFDESLTLGDEEGDRVVQGLALLRLGILDRLEGTYERSRARLEACLTLFEERRHALGVMLARNALADLARVQGRFDEAGQILRAQLRRLTTTRQRAFIADQLGAFGMLAIARGDHATGVRLLTVAARNGSFGAVVRPDVWIEGRAALATARAAMGEEAFEAASIGGQALPLEEAITEALASSPPADQDLGAEEAVPIVALSSRAVADLTRREAEVLRRLAGGQTNAEIAADLALSVHTVERHVSNLYLKIDAHNRAEATAYALRHGLA